MEIPPPRLPECLVWPLIVQLDHEKEVTGMFLSGHPLDHHKFEMKHYGITSISAFNEFKEEVSKQANPGRSFRLLGLVADAQHKISRQGNKYGNFVLEDYSGKTDFVLWSEDYAKFETLLKQGNTVFINGFFRQRYNRPEFEFKVSSVSFAETLKRNLTKSVQLEMNPTHLTAEVLNFIDKNVKNHPGKATLKFTLAEPASKQKISLVTMDNGFEMNDEMAEFLEQRPEFDVSVVTG